MKWNDDNDNDDKYNNNRHISIEITDSEKTETTWDEYIPEWVRRAVNK